MPAIVPLDGEQEGDVDVDAVEQEFLEAVANAFLNALVRRVTAGRSVDRISSVASFFLSRIDVLVDELLERKTDTDARALRGKIAVANAKLAYQSLKRIFSAERWEALRAKGARVQRLLWASTGTKNPDYPDLIVRRAADRPDDCEHDC